MLYISPVNEAVCRNGLVGQVLKWSEKIETSKAVLAGQMRSDMKELQTNWLPEDNPRQNLSKGWRKNIRYVFAYNGNAEITHYAKLELRDTDVHLHWVVGRPEQSGRIDCGPGVVPLRALLSFVATAAKLLGKPVVLLADTPELITKYTESGFELTGRKESSKDEMILKLENIDRPSQTAYKGQREHEHWVFGGEHSLAEYLRDGGS